jgi:hypothetical protein
MRAWRHEATLEMEYTVMLEAQAAVAAMASLERAVFRAWRYRVLRRHALPLKVCPRTPPLRPES